MNIGVAGPEDDKEGEGHGEKNEYTAGKKESWIMGFTVPTC